MLLAATLDLQQKVFKKYYRCSYCGYQFGVGAGNAQGVAPVAPKYCPTCRSAATHLSES